MPIVPYQADWPDIERSPVMPSDPTYLRSTKLHRVNAAAKMLDVSRPTIYRLVRAGELTLVKIGKRASAITEDSLREFIAAHSRLEGDGS